MKIVVHGVSESIQKFNALQVRTALNNGIKKSVFHLTGVAQKETPVGATGFLRSAYRQRFSDLRGELVNTKEYAKAVHEGRKPGKAPKVEHIALWVARKGIPVPPFVIARSIGRKGTKGNPFITRTFESEKNKVDAIVRGEVYDLINRSFLN